MVAYLLAASVMLVMSAMQRQTRAPGDPALGVIARRPETSTNAD